MFILIAWDKLCTFPLLKRCLYPTTLSCLQFEKYKVTIAAVKKEAMLTRNILKIFIQYNFLPLLLLYKYIALIVKQFQNKIK